jgi:hypothetical protein
MCYVQSALYSAERSRSPAMGGVVMAAKILLFLGLALVMVSSEGYAVDESICSTDVAVVFHDNGSLKSCALKDEDYEANNVQCHNGSLISFYDNGSLESCILSTPTTVGENDCDEFSRISLYPDGNLKSCMKPSN